MSEGATTCVLSRRGFAICTGHPREPSTSGFNIERLEAIGGPDSRRVSGGPPSTPDRPLATTYKLLYIRWIRAHPRSPTSWQQSILSRLVPPQPPPRSIDRIDDRGACIVAKGGQGGGGLQNIDSSSGRGYGEAARHRSSLRLPICLFLFPAARGYTPGTLGPPTGPLHNSFIKSLRHVSPFIKC